MLKPHHLAIKRLRLSLCIGAQLVLTACGTATQNPAGPTATPATTNTPPVNGSMSANIDGAQWTANTVVTLKSPATLGLPSGSLSVTGSSTSPSLIMGFAVPAAAGTYTIGSAGAQNAGFQDSSGGAWTANEFKGSGTITVSSFTSTSASGTFAFNLPSLVNTTATGTKVITQGVFNVTF